MAKTDPDTLSASQIDLLRLAQGWVRLEQRLDAALGNVRGIRFSEYRMLRVLADDPRDGVSRAELARAVGLSPSGVTRALAPLEKLRIVRTRKHERDARQALASLTKAGRDLVADASAVVEDLLTAALADLPGSAWQVSELIEDLGRA